jgi:hypothetical protein
MNWQKDCVTMFTKDFRFNRKTESSLCPEAYNMFENVQHVRNWPAVGYIAIPTIGILGLNVSSGELIGFELRFNTLAAIGSLEFEPDYCLPASVASVTTINTIDRLTKTQIITETVGMILRHWWCGSYAAIMYDG